MSLSAGRMELEEEPFSEKISDSFTQIELTALIQEDVLIVFRIVLRDVLKKESSKPGNRRC
jgi:hypothetical protein